MSDESTIQAIGLVEFNSIGVGIEAADAMLKVSHVALLMAKTVCPGKYICLVKGSVAAVQSCVDRGIEIGQEAAIDHLFIPRVHESIFPAISATSKIMEPGALGVIETFSIASAVEAADFAAKAAKVQLIEVRLAVGLGGKSFVTLTGEISAVRSAVEAGTRPVAEKGLLVHKVVIPSPREELFHSMM